MYPTIDTDDILNAIYEHAQVKFECEGCGDDSRDGSKLARKKLDELIAKIYAQGRKEGLSVMDNARNYLAYAERERGPKRIHGKFHAAENLRALREEYES